jgi:hypothetical protein
MNNKRQDNRKSVISFSATRRTLTILFSKLTRAIIKDRVRLSLPIICSAGLFACSDLKDAQQTRATPTSAAGAYMQEKQIDQGHDEDIEAYQWFY